MQPAPLTLAGTIASRGLVVGFWALAGLAREHGVELLGDRKLKELAVEVVKHAD